MLRVLYLLAALIMPICFTAGCWPSKNAPAPVPPAFTETISSGPIELTFIADPAAVHLDRDILLTIRVCAPSNMEVRLPPLGNRLKGFVINGAFTRDGQTSNGKPAKEYCFRLTPTLADEYRLAPLAITWINREREPHSEGWFATRPVIFQAVAVAKGLPAATIHDITSPVWIYPPFKTVALWTLAIVCVAGFFFLLWWLSRRIHKAIQLRRMSPRERALNQLVELLKQDLVGKGKIKEFYLELTMIVRRYIEGAHSIRAPEQTTEEFLVATTNNPSFNPEVVKKLKVFLQTSDLVKFAVYCPAKEIIDQTLSTACDYIDTDEQFQQKVKKT